MNLEVHWREGHAFDAISNTGHVVRIDSVGENEGAPTGMNPKKLLLASICGCSGIDVVDILKKMKVPFSKLNIYAETEQTDDVPKVFKYVNIVYEADVLPEDEDKLKRAVSLSMEKYCGVSAMLAKHCPINHSTKLIA
jgi:putative redox protein